MNSTAIWSEIKNKILHGQDQNSFPFFFFIIIGFNHIAAILDFKLPYEIVWIIITCWFFTWESLLWLDHVEEASSLYNFIVEDEAALLECKAAILDNISCHVSGWIRYFFKHNKNYTDYKVLFNIFINPNLLY